MAAFNIQGRPLSRMQLNTVFVSGAQRDRARSLATSAALSKPRVVSTREHAHAKALPTMQGLSARTCTPEALPPAGLEVLYIFDSGDVQPGAASASVAHISSIQQQPPAGGYRFQQEIRAAQVGNSNSAPPASGAMFLQEQPAAKSGDNATLPPAAGAFFLRHQPAAKSGETPTFRTAGGTAFLQDICGAKAGGVVDSHGPSYIWPSAGPFTCADDLAAANACYVGYLPATPCTPRLQHWEDDCEAADPEALILPRPATPTPPAAPGSFAAAALMSADGITRTAGATAFLLHMVQSAAHQEAQGFSTSDGPTQLCADGSLPTAGAIAFMRESRAPATRPCCTGGSSLSHARPHGPALLLLDGSAVTAGAAAFAASRR